MKDTVLLDAIKKLESSPNLSDEEYRKKMSHMNDEIDINNLKFGEKDYDILEHIVFD